MTALAVERHEPVEAVLEEWDALADRLGASPFLHPGWTTAWWRAFGTGRLETLTARRGGSLVGIVPLAGQGGALRSPSNWHTAEFAFLAEDASAAAELARGLFASQPRRVELAFVEAGETLDAMRGAAGAAGYRVLERTYERSPYIEITGAWGAFEKQLGRKLLGELRRRRRRLEDEGAVALTIEDGTERLPELLEEGFRVEAAGWKGEHGSAIASDPQTREFYREVAEWASAHGWLRLAFLRLDSRPLAFDYCLEQAGGSHYLVKTGFDPDFRRYAPGMLLRYEMLARAFSEGFRSYEFLGGLEPWKSEWAETVRERMLFQAFSPSLPGFAGWAAFAHGRPLAKLFQSALRR